MNMEKKFCSLSFEFLNFLDAVPSCFLSKTWDLACVIAYTIQKIIEMGYKQDFLPKLQTSKKSTFDGKGTATKAKTLTADIVVRQKST